MSRIVLFVLAGVAVLGSAAPVSAQEIFCTVVGTKQGDFRGDRGGNEIAVFSLTGEITTPFDATTGRLTGARTHKPITIIKELDASSPQFFEAAVTGEVLKSVTCTFYRAYRNGGGTGGMSQPYFKVTLTDAYIVDYRDTGDGINGAAPGDEHERISLTYYKIALTTEPVSKTIAEDYWYAVN